MHSTTGLFRRPANRTAVRSKVSSDVKQATWNEPLPKKQASPAAKKQGRPSATKAAPKAPRTLNGSKKPPRTIYQYMAQERP